jgi:hypothetical protein
MTDTAEIRAALTLICFEPMSQRHVIFLSFVRFCILAEDGMRMSSRSARRVNTFICPVVRLMLVIAALALVARCRGAA